eukprot:gb/GECH01009578.1/.p1 GENE.gb/GECH01009578.1/~~gb/GECH01009578.1/.p1  ORF type:complete len:786 (+),score=150.84 gb/GECH01009578.1/:1-2358(+)
MSEPPSESTSTPRPSPPDKKQRPSHKPRPSVVQRMRHRAHRQHEHIRRHIKAEMNTNDDVTHTSPQQTGSNGQVTRGGSGRSGSVPATAEGNGGDGPARYRTQSSPPSSSKSHGSRKTDNIRTNIHNHALKRVDNWSPAEVEAWLQDQHDPFLAAVGTHLSSLGVTGKMLRDIPTDISALKERYGIHAFGDRWKLIHIVSRLLQHGAWAFEPNTAARKGMARGALSSRRNGTDAHPSPPLPAAPRILPYSAESTVPSSQRDSVMVTSTLPAARNAIRSMTATAWTAEMVAVWLREVSTDDGMTERCTLAFQRHHIDGRVLVGGDMTEEVLREELGIEGEEGRCHLATEIRRLEETGVFRPSSTTGIRTPSGDNNHHTSGERLLPSSSSSSSSSSSGEGVHQHDSILHRMEKVQRKVDASEELHRKLLRDIHRGRTEWGIPIAGGDEEESWTTMLEALSDEDQLQRYFLPLLPEYQGDAEDPVRIKLIITEILHSSLSRNIRTAASSVANPVPQFPTWGMFHTALIVGPWYLEWTASAVCVPRLPRSRFPLLTTDMPAFTAPVSLAEVRHRLARLIVGWNTRRGYTNQTVRPRPQRQRQRQRHDGIGIDGRGVPTETAANCQEFTEAILHTLGVDMQPMRNTALGDYLDEMRQHGMSRMRFKIVPRLQKELLRRQERDNGDALGGELMYFADEKQLPRVKKIIFNTHEELDLFVLYLTALIPEFEVLYKYEYLLLKGFDRAFWLRHISYRGRDAVARPYRYRKSTSYSQCPFYDPTTTGSVFKRRN